MLNIAFHLPRTFAGGISVSKKTVATATMDDALNHSNESTQDNSESEQDDELLPENFEIGLSLPKSLLTFIGSSVRWDPNKSVSPYKNHVAELNVRPPRVV